MNQPVETTHTLAVRTLVERANRLLAEAREAERTVNEILSRN